MKVILYMATSINGMITRNSDDSDWVSEVDWDEFNALKNQSKVIVMGSKTYEQFVDDFPQKGALNIVMTNNKELLSKNITGALFTNKSPTEVVQMLEEKGFNQVMLVGGMTLNTPFLKEDLIDEIWIDIHPLLIGRGKTIFGETDIFKKAKLLETKTLKGGLILLKYSLTAK